MSKEEMGDEIEKYLAKQENRFQSVIQNIKGLLEKEKVKNRKLNHKQAMQGSVTTKSEMLSYFSGVIHETSPTLQSTNQNKHSNILSKPRGKTAGSSRKMHLRNTLNNPSKFGGQDKGLRLG